MISPTLPLWRTALLLSLAAALLLPGAPLAAQGAERCFPETGYCISGPLRSYWEAHGSLRVFGYPITPLQTEAVEGQPLPVQWFQRDRLEDHGPAGVMAGRLGAQLLEARGQPWLPRGPIERRAGCRSFPETGYALCEPFLGYWERNGGLARFGYPISPVQEEVLGSWSGDVQYFERRRMEHHSELAGTPYEVLLGLLGQTLRQLSALEACPTPIYGPWRAAFTALSIGGALGCPSPAEEGVAMATQPFEGGQMIWVDRGAQGRIIIVELRGRAEPTAPRGALYVALVYEDTWAEGQPVDSGLTPPPGHLEPRRGFGKLWRDRPQLRQSLGWALAPEQPSTGVYQAWSGGAMLSAPELGDPHHSFFWVRAFLTDSADEVVRQ